MEAKAVKAIFPGSFDPITKGHLDVIERGLNLFDTLVIAVGENSSKDSVFTPQERVEMIREIVKDKSRVTVESYDSLTVEYAKKIGATVMLRGLRNLTDVQYEFQLAMTNRAVAGIETVFVMTSEKYGFVNSTMVREVAILGGDVSDLVPELAYNKLREKLNLDK